MEARTANLIHPTLAVQIGRLRLPSGLLAMCLRLSAQAMVLGVNDVELADAYPYPPAGRWLRANMVASIDGAASFDGRVSPLGN
jgi:hypothetical protein